MQAAAEKTCGPTSPQCVCAVALPCKKKGAAQPWERHTLFLCIVTCIAALPLSFNDANGVTAGGSHASKVSSCKPALYAQSGPQYIACDSCPAPTQIPSFA